MAAASTSNGTMSVQTILTHPGVDNVVIDQDNINQLMDGAQQIETATASVNDGNAIDAIKTLLGMMAMVIRILVKLIVNFSSHMGSFETMVENKILALQGQSQATFASARVGYESLAKRWTISQWRWLG